jgi:hypothetical protein
MAQLLDCFAALVVGPATSGRTRWLAMTRLKLNSSTLALPPHRGVEAPAAGTEGDDGEHAADEREVIEENDALEARLGRRRQPIAKAFPGAT